MDKKWNLQDIRPAEPRKRIVPSEQRPLQQRPPERVLENREEEGTVHVAIENGTKKKRNGILIALVVFIVIVIGGFIASFLMRGADITVYSKNRQPNVNATFEIYKTPQVGELSYEIMSLEADGERQVTATGEESVQTQATGEIIIVNETTNPERLRKNTRFETEDGLIFKITESVVVPGAGTGDDGSTVPGSIRAEVFADGVGEQYNIAPSRLTIPGYKEGGFEDLYNAVYAQNPERFTGGFDGPKFIIDETELETQKQSLQTELRNALLDRIPGERPAGFVVFDDAVTFTYQTLPAVEYGDNLVTIKEKAILQIPIFKEEQFAIHLAAATIPGYEGEAVRIDNYDTLTFSYVSATTSSTDIGAQDSLSIKLVGRPHIVWVFDEGKLKTDLLGKNKTALPTVLGGYPAIEKAEAVVRPFWKRVFPESLDEITIYEVVQAPTE